MCIVPSSLSQYLCAGALSVQPESSDSARTPRTENALQVNRPINCVPPVGDESFIHRGGGRADHHFRLRHGPTKHPLAKPLCSMLGAPHDSFRRTTAARMPLFPLRCLALCPEYAGYYWRNGVTWQDAPSHYASDQQ